MKCSLCNTKVETTFLEKVKGTYIKKNGKLKLMCPACQKQYTKEEILKKL